MSGIQQMLLGGVPQLSVLVHNTGEGGGQGVYTKAAGDSSIQFGNTGTFTASAPGSGTPSYAWLLAGLPSQAEILIHQVSGTAVTGITLDTYLNLSTSRGCNLAWPGGAGSSTASLQISIRNAATLTVLVSAVAVTLNTNP
jgi:hypothetical protein